MHVYYLFIIATKKFGIWESNNFSHFLIIWSNSTHYANFIAGVLLSRHIMLTKRFVVTPVHMLIIKVMLMCGQSNPNRI